MGSAGRRETSSPWASPLGAGCELVKGGAVAGARGLQFRGSGGSVEVNVEPCQSNNFLNRSAPCFGIW